MNPDLDRLAPYPFARLDALLAGIDPPAGLAPIALTLGEPRMPAPRFIADRLAAALDGLNRYPKTVGEQPLRAAAADWLSRRFRLPDGAVDPATQLLPVNGTREALFALAQAVVDRGAAPVVVCPNPLYQIYEGAALMAGAEPRYVPWRPDGGGLDLDGLDAADWSRCQLLYLCSPGNPTGEVLDRDFLARVIGLADRHDFVIAADECYADIYPPGSPPPGLLGVCADLGRNDFARCLVFHSLSKRSGVPGLRSGFVAGDASIVAAFLRYRTYHGCAMSPPTQAASAEAWQDDAHAEAHRRAYAERIDACLALLEPVLDVRRPAGAFYLWAGTPVDDREFARELYRHCGVRVLPGSFLGRDGPGGNPGAGRVRVSLVEDLGVCVTAATRIAGFCATRFEARGAR